MRLLLSLFFVLSISDAALASRASVSAVRQNGEDFMEAAARHSMMTPASYRLPQTLARPLKNLDIMTIPDVGSQNDLLNQFNYIRDLRFLESQRPQFLRRMTWLYPDDGCYARAEMAARLLMRQHFVTPKKIFVFGNLRAQTVNTRSGIVEWWYHVAVTYRVANTVYVFDPAIEPKQPLKLEEWHKAVGGERSSLTYAVCEHGTFDPNSDCNKKDQISESEAISEQANFLSAEWDRLLKLRRNPEKELGDFPPWKN